MEVLILLLVMAVGFTFRLIFFLDKSTDELVSLWFIQRNSSSNWLKFKVEDSVIEGYSGYPSLQHYIISRFEEKYWPYVGKLLNILYDLITGILVYFIAKYLVLWVDIDTKGLQMLPWLSVALFLTTPILLPITARMRAISARSLGLLLTTTYFLVLGLIVINGHYYLIPVTVIVGYLIILSSQFALQVLIFFSILLALLQLSVVPILLLVLIFIIPWLIPNSNAKKILLHSWNHKIWYLRNKGEGTTATSRNHIKKIISLPVDLVKRPKKAVKFMIENFTLSIALYSAPAMFIVIWNYLANENTSTALLIHGNPWLEYFWYISLASLITFGFISIPKFSFLGQAERYFEYSAPFFSLLFVAVIMITTDEGMSYQILSVLALLHITFILINFLWLKKGEFSKNYENLDQEFDEVVNWFKNEENEIKLLLYPLKYSYLFSILMKRKGLSKNIKLYYRFIKRSGEHGFKYFEEDIGGYVKVGETWKKSIDVLSIDPKDLMSKYGITHIVIDTRFEEGVLYTWGEEFKNLLDSPLFVNEKYKICRVH